MEPIFDGLDQKTIDTILEYGHQVIYVSPRQGEEGTPFAYTVGRAIKDQPELLMTGSIAPGVMGQILNDAVRMHDEGTHVLCDGYEYPPHTLFQNGFKARVVAVDPRASEMFQAINIMGDDVEALQIVWPDIHGCFPDEPGYSLPAEAQPIHRKEGQAEKSID